MKTQISRHSHRPDKRYSGVYQQQGRMITDADWNELVEIVTERVAEALRDVVASGAPRGRGVEIVPLAGGFGIRGGWIYADGVAARAEPAAGIDAETFTYDQQADFPAPPPLPETAFVLYADVWERPVVSLEDPAHLRDPALHGADTTTRTQTMVQVKWCPDAGYLDERTHPQQGSAELTLRLRAPREEPDPCDPCADEVAVAARTGNYLFRLEVHDVEEISKAGGRLVLKWSSENGAEQHEVERAPSYFRTGDWIYEFYDETSEKHLGVHLAPGFTPVRPTLHAGWPAAPPEDLPWVRRWDGYCVLESRGGIWSLVEGQDRVTELSTEGSADADGHVALGTKSVEIQLKALTLALPLTPGKKSKLAADVFFVAGDYWLAPVREAVHQTGSVVLEAAPPLGVVHHYVKLASVADDGTVESLTTAENRRMSFPPLTDLRAGDVGYETRCASEGRAPLFDLSHDTVEKALDQICRIGAPHVGYEPDPECDDLQGIGDVQGALDALCKRPTGGSVSREIVQPGHGFRVGDAIRFDTEEELYVKARANDAATTGLFLVSEVKGVEFTLLQAGYLDLTVGYEPDPVPEDLLLQPGHYYFVSAEAEGALSEEEPLFALSNPILYADSETGGYVLPWRPSDPVSSGRAAKEYIDHLFVGSVAAFAMETPPEGWLECDGRAVSRADYARLFNRIGTEFGVGDGSTTFNLPDLRGLFIRGWDHYRNLDSGRTFGNLQQDQFQGHRLPVFGGGGSDTGIGTNTQAHHGEVGHYYGSAEFGDTRIGWAVGMASDGVNGEPRVGQETRPKNVSLMYCIKS